MTLDAPTPLSRSADPRNSGLDALRAFACVMVVLFHLHTVGKIGFGVLDPVIQGSNTGVFVFFALSGYLLYRPFVGRQPDPLTYGLKRAARILPGYFVALVGLVVLTGDSLPFKYPLPYLFVASGYSAPLRDFMGSAWTLSAEILFYVSVPLIAIVAAGHQVRVLALLGGASAIAAIVGSLIVSGDDQVWLGAYPFVFYAFVPGMLLAVLAQSRPDVTYQLGNWPWLVLGATYLVLGALFSASPIAFAPAIGAALLIGWLLRHPVPGGRILVFAGGMSYAVYLWHKDAIISFGPAIGVAIAVVAAALSWSIIEQPILNSSHRLAKRWMSRRDLQGPARAGTA